MSPARSKPRRGASPVGESGWTARRGYSYNGNNSMIVLYVAMIVAVAALAAFLLRFDSRSKTTPSKRV